MGANASRGTDNQSLIDRLIDSRSPVPPDVERAMRLVDRGDYFEEHSSRAYIDLAWRSGHIHLSAPSIYLSVLRHLDLAPGQRFLNIGSGSGYFNTVAGLILGYSGVNHGIELIPENVEFARKQLHKFLCESDAPLERDFCVPMFVQGNIFHLLCSPENGSSPAYNGPTQSDGTQSDSEAEEDDPPIRQAERDPDLDQSDDSPIRQAERNPVVNHSDSSSIGQAERNPEQDQSDELPNDVAVQTVQSGDTDMHTDQYRPGYYLNVAIDPSPPVDLTNSSDLNGKRWPLYDRMYVGAAVRNRTHLKSILRFLKIGGVLIAPVQDELVKITRVSTNRIRRVDLMSVSFAPLIIPQRGSPTLQISPPTTEAPTLLRLCGRVLRSILRKRIEARHNGVPTLGRLKAVDIESDCKKARQLDTSAELDTTATSSDLPTTSGSDSDSTDSNNDDQTNGHASDSQQSDSTGSPETSRPSVAMRRLLRHLLDHSRLMPNGEAPAVRDQSGEDMPDAEPDHLARSGLWMLNLMQERDASESENNHHQDGSAAVRVQVQVSNRFFSALNQAEPSQAENSTPQTTPSSAMSRTTDGQSHRGRGKKRRLQYQPPSYRYRDEMRKMMSDELKLPDFFIRDALLI